jgi:hypothetical protein
LYSNNEPPPEPVDPLLDAEADVFMTQQKPEEYLWKSYDFLFPAGKLAKLIKIHDYW